MIMIPALEARRLYGKALCMTTLAWKPCAGCAGPTQVMLAMLLGTTAIRRAQLSSYHLAADSDEAGVLGSSSRLRHWANDGAGA
jgi:hypothetical protein